MKIYYTGSKSHLISAQSFTVEAKKSIAPTKVDLAHWNIYFAVFNTRFDNK